MRILVFGSLNIDHDYYVDHRGAPGETITADSLSLAVGGKGLNQAIAIAKAGASVALAGAVGPDGGMLLQTLQDHGVDVSLIKHVDQPTGHAIITIDRHGSNDIMIFGGANRQIDAAYVSQVLAGYGPGDIMVVENEISAMKDVLSQAHAKGMTIVANPSPFDPQILGWPLDDIDWFFINEVEGAGLTGGADIPSMPAALAARFPKAQVVLTLGGQGAYYLHAGQAQHQPASHVKAIDTVGAGDTFLGYFTAGLARGRDPRACLRLASTAAGICVTRKGAAASIPTADEVEAVLASSPATD